jgi:hypothetical protein
MMYCRSRGILAVFLFCIGACVLAGEALAESGSNVLAQSKVANADIARCEQTKKDQALIDCVGAAMGKFAANVNRGEAPTRAPQIISMAREASGIRGKPKAEALATLNKLIAIARGLAAKGVADFRPAYSAVAGVFARAVNALEKTSAPAPEKK